MLDLIENKSVDNLRNWPRGKKFKSLVFFFCFFGPANSVCGIIG